MRLHLGCGTRNFGPDWVHVDVEDHPHVDIHHPVDTLPMVESNSVYLVYACHVLEHFMHREVETVLAEWRRVLRPGGVLRLAVPDFASLVKIYRKTGDISTILGPLMGGQKGFIYNFHYTAFDSKSLEKILVSAGFKDVRSWDWRKVDHGIHDDFSQAYWPHMAKEDPDAIQVSLNMEATK